jgi:serine/threonine protein kinase
MTSLAQRIGECEASDTTATSDGIDHVGPPPRLGRYEVVKALGAGSYALVFAAYDTALERHVALKVFREPYATAEIRREALALARIDHPNVVKLHEVGEADGLVFLVLDLVRGRTLRDYVGEWHDWREIVGLFIQAARGLAAVHDAGFVHSDVKPDNILIGGNGRVHIADLGRARRLGDTQDGDGGAVSYMAPERLMGASSSAAADQFGLCLVLWEVLYRTRPWSMNSVELMGSTKPVRARLRTDVPRRLLRVIQRGLAASSRERFENMDVLADALTRVLVDARRAEDRRRMFAAAVAAAAMLLGLAWLMSQWI